MLQLTVNQGRIKPMETKHLFNTASLTANISRSFVKGGINMNFRWYIVSFRTMMEAVTG